MSSSKTTDKPVICVCENNGVVCIATRADYDAASNEYWAAVRAGKLRHTPFKWDMRNGIRLKPKKLFVFGKCSPAHALLMKRCHAERAIFSFPGSYDTAKDERTFSDATAYILGQRLKVKDLKDELYFDVIPPDQSFPMDLRIIGYDSWQEALPESVEITTPSPVSVESTEGRRVSPVEFFEIEWRRVWRDMMSPPSIENLIVTFFLEDGFAIRELIFEDDGESKPDLGILTLVRINHDSGVGNVFGKEAFFTSSVKKGEIPIRLGSSSGALFNKRYMFHKVVLEKPSKP